MQKRKKLFTTMLAILVAVIAVSLHYFYDPWCFYWKVSPKEEALRIDMIQSAQQYLGCQESDGTHKPIIDRYNEHEPLALGYQVQYTDSWCAVFVSTVAIDTDLTSIIPTECGCQRQIELFQQLGRWDEYDNAIPLPGDLIYYDWDMDSWGETVGWADHVGIVVGTKWPFVKVIEGNWEDRVSTKILLLGDNTIRGYARPDYASIAK